MQNHKHYDLGNMYTNERGAPLNELNINKCTGSLEKIEIISKSKNERKKWSNNKTRRYGRITQSQFEEEFNKYCIASWEGEEVPEYPNKGFH